MAILTFSSVQLVTNMLGWIMIERTLRIRINSKMFDKSSNRPLPIEESLYYCHSSRYVCLPVRQQASVECVDVAFFLPQSEGGEVPHKVDPGLSPPCHQPQGQVVSCGQHWPRQTLPTKRRPKGRRTPVPSIIELNVWASMTRVPRALTRGGLQSRVERSRAPRRLWEDRGGAQRGHS